MTPPLAQNKPAPVKVSTTVPKPTTLNQTPVLETNPPSDVLPADLGGPNPTPYLFPLALVVFLGISAGGVFFIRKSKSKSIPGDDFDLLDE